MTIPAPSMKSEANHRLSGTIGEDNRASSRAVARWARREGGLLGELESARDAERLRFGCDLLMGWDGPLRFGGVAVAGLDVGVLCRVPPKTRDRDQRLIDIKPGETGMVARAMTVVVRSLKAFCRPLL